MYFAIHSSALISLSRETVHYKFLDKELWLIGFQFAFVKERNCTKTIKPVGKIELFILNQMCLWNTTYLLNYSWNSLTRSRWDKRKYFELSEVWVKHRISTIVFMSIEDGFSTFRVMIHTSYNVNTLYNWFCAF